MNGKNENTKDTGLYKELSSIYEQREKILEAFIAQYKLKPDEVEQVVEYTNNGIRWYLKKKQIFSFIKCDFCEKPATAFNFFTKKYACEEDWEKTKNY